MIRRLLRFCGFEVHVWKYRNPYSRTCIHCGQQQDYYVWAYAERDVPIGWENMYSTDNPCGDT